LFEVVAYMPNYFIKLILRPGIQCTNVCEEKGHFANVTILRNGMLTMYAV